VIFLLTTRHTPTDPDADLSPDQIDRVMRRTLLGVSGHGLVEDPEVYSDQDTTTWSFRCDNEQEGREVLEGLRQVLRALTTWEITVEVQEERVRTYDRHGEPHDEVLRTKTGKVITEAQIAAWVEEAEAGYDPSTIQSRRSNG
jgi:hypothetical protein